MKFLAPALLLLTSLALSGAVSVDSALEQDLLSIKEPRSSPSESEAQPHIGGPLVIMPLSLDKRNYDAHKTSPAPSLVANEVGKGIHPVIVLLGRDGPEYLDLNDLDESHDLSTRSETHMMLHRRGLFGKLFKWVASASIVVTIFNALHIHLDRGDGNQNGGSSSRRDFAGLDDSLASMVKARAFEEGSKSPVIILIPGPQN
ncbi:hypothetical protein OC846_005969 [Tilletia horrida]|uniref:Uncharacterized protein n=1 Tax=Tilletia horrida TaxID=155126 RepID=A0AAN6GKS5_9BASI|nr:hypothetical protein OC846_005969 [Tilletia horrida]